MKRSSVRENYLVSIEEGTGGNIVFDQPNGPWEYLGNYGLRATAQPGYVFSAWTGNVSSRNSLVNGTSDSNNSIIVTSDISLTATFEEMDYTVAVLSTEGGEVSGSGTYTISAPPTLQALPFAGWEFSHWEANETHLTQLASDTSPDSLINLAGAPSAMEFTAQFKKITHTIELHAIGEGSINGSRDLSMELPNGTEISLVATPADGWRFERWYDIETESPYSPVLTVTADENLDFSALFIPNTYNLNLVAGPNGSVSEGGTYDFGSEISISANPNDGFKFIGWDGGGSSINNSNDKNATITIPDHNLTIIAQFAPTTVDVNVQIIGSGNVSGGGDFTFGETAILEANPGIGHVLEKWEWTDLEGNAIYSSLNPLQLDMDRNFSITAHFIPIPERHIDYELLSSPANAGIVFDDPSLRFWDVNTELWERTLLAEANPGYSFLGWTATSGVVFNPSRLSTVTVCSPSDDAIIGANFSANSYTLQTTHITSNGTIEGIGDNFSYNEEVTIKAIPSDNKEFSHWKVLDSNSYSAYLGESSISGGSPKLFINEKESPSLTLLRGHTYEFDVQLEEDNSFFLSTSKYNDDTFADEYLSGVINSRATEGTVSFTVPLNAPSRLYYHSSKYPYSGNNLRIIDRSDSDILPYPNSSEIKLVMDHDIHLEAVFKDQEHTLSITSNEDWVCKLFRRHFPRWIYRKSYSYSR